MFKFDFQLEEEDDEVQIPVSAQPQPSASAGAPTESNEPTSEEGAHKTLTTLDKCYHVPLDELIKLLPEEISYSPLHHPCLTAPLLRRDLYDARFQLYNRHSHPAQPGEVEAAEATEAGDRTEEGEEYVDAKTDLIPGLYEGGLKSWEGGVDLVEVLSSVGEGADGQSDTDTDSPATEQRVGDWVKGGRVLEVGCGTSLPTAYLLRSLLSLPPSNSPAKTIFHVQDYNSLVLSLVTLPNLILATLPYLPTEALHQPEEEEDVESVLPDLENPGSLILTPTLIEAFRKILDERGVELLFTFGHWTGLAKDLKGKEGYGLVLTAETIYAEESNLPLLDVLRSSVKKGDKTKAEVQVGLEDSLGGLRVDDEWKTRPLREGGDGYVLVAAKILYFGVGGGLQGFLDLVKSSGGWSKGVKDWVKGVGRKVVQVGW